MVSLVQVPRLTPARDLVVTLEPHRVSIAHKRTGEVYLQGQMWRGIIPQESVWMQGDGPGEDGCLLLLRKMNLELLTRCSGMHTSGGLCHWFMHAIC